MKALDVIPIIISLIALVISFRNMGISVQKNRLDVEKDHQLQANIINDSFVKFDVRSPYEAFLGIPKQETVEARAKMILLLLQINLLRTVFNCKKVLSAEQVKDYENWGSQILRPWIESDVRLREAFQLSIKSEDGGKAFTEWLVKVIPVVGADVL